MTEREVCLVKRDAPPFAFTCQYPPRQGLTGLFLLSITHRLAYPCSHKSYLGKSIRTATASA